jgi:SNF2 family DNA or RNA helicase
MGKTTDNFFVWRKRYFNDKNESRRGMRNYWPEYQITPVAKEYFKQLLQECSLSAKKDKVLDLPELIRTSLYCEMSPPQKKHYESMKEYLFAIDKDGNELNAANMLTRTLRLQQITAGFLGDTEIVHTTKADCVDAVAINNRLQALSDAIEMTKGEQFLIWTIFKPTYAQIGKFLSDRNLSFGLLTGEQNAEERFETMEDFQAGNLRALIAHPKAGGIGVNLTAASFSIHYTRSFSLVDDLQAEARNYRGGSERHARVTRVDIITADTIDEDIAAALKSKKSVQDFILGLKEKRHGR